MATTTGSLEGQHSRFVSPLPSTIAPRSLSAVLQPGQWFPGLLEHAILLSKVQAFALDLIEGCSIHFGPFFQLGQFPLDGTRALGVLPYPL